MRSKTLIGLMLAATFAGETLAQTPTASQFEQERQRIETARKAMFDADNPATTNAPHSFPNVPTPARAEIDIEAIARQYERKTAARKTDDLMIFASFTMPKASLKRLISQAHRVGASVILRGFKNNSLKATALAINGLGESGGNVLIHPNAFAQYKINAVPTVVLAKTGSNGRVDSDGCALPDHFVSLSGDVSLDYALAEMARRAPLFEPVATRYLRQLRGRD